MASLITKAVRHIKRQAREGRKTYRTKHLLDVGCQLLNAHDHESLSVARFAKEAGVSVGAFYARFESKEEFLFRIVYARLDRASALACDELHLNRWQGASAARIVREIVAHIIYTLNSSCVGPVRTAWKCGQLDPKFLSPLLTYRAAVADQAVVLLKPHIKAKTGELQIRAAVQIMLATTIDALFQDEGPLRAGRQRLADTLTRTMVLLLGIDAGGEVSAVESDQLSDAVIVPSPEIAVAATISALIVKTEPDRAEETEPPPKAATKARAVKMKAAPRLRPPRRVHFL